MEPLVRLHWFPGRARDLEGLVIRFGQEKTIMIYLSMKIRFTHSFPPAEQRTK
jgi:hypothetical protein